jgi:hypothetical protein
VPLIQIVPFGFKTLAQALIHLFVNFKFSCKVSGLSHSPLSTLSILPPLQVMPQLERLYGGSAKIISTDSFGSFDKIFIESPKYNLKSLSSKKGFMISSAFIFNQLILHQCSFQVYNVMKNIKNIK